MVSAVCAVTTCGALTAGAVSAGTVAAGTLSPGTVPGGTGRLAPAIPPGGTSPAWAVAEPVPGISTLDHNGSAQLEAVSCPVVDACGAGGFYIDGSDNHDQAFVVSESGGVWGSPQQVPTVPQLNTGGDASVTAISCFTAGECGVSGYYTDSSGLQSFVGSQVGGTWDGSMQLPGSESSFGEPVTESCPGFARCTIGGFLTDVHGNEQPYVDDQGPSFDWRADPSLTGEPSTGGSARVTSVSCKTAGNCTAGGWYSDDGRQGAFVADEVNGAWHAAGIVAGSLNKGGNAQVSQVSCEAAGYCAAVGGQFQVWSASERGGKWANAQPLIGLISLNAGESQVNGLSCAHVTSCGMVGYYTDSKGRQQPLVALGAIAASTEITEKLSAHTVVYGHEQAERVFVGTASQFGAYPTGTVTVKAGITGAVTACVITLKEGIGSCLVPAAKFRAGPVALTAFYGGTVELRGSTSNTLTFTVAKAATKTRLALSAGTITYGHEQAEHLAVAVAPQYGGVPAGTVTVTAGTATVCVIRLKAGKGSCTLTSARLKPGTYHLVASYHGGTDFTGSSSPPATVVVVK